MSEFGSVKVDDLGLSFMDLKEAEASICGSEEASSSTLFGPKQDAKDFSQWAGCDGKLYFPYNPTDKLGKISDFVTAAALAQREKEKDLERQEQQKKKDAMKAAKKAAKVKSKEDTKEDAEPEDDDMGFVTVEDTRATQVSNKRSQQQKQNYNKNQQPQYQQSGVPKNMMGNLKAKSKKDKAKQNYYLTNIVKQLRCNLRDNSIDAHSDWSLIKEFNKQQFDRLPTLRPVFLESIKECGELLAYDYAWDKVTGKKPRTLKTDSVSHETMEPSIYDDPVMVDLIEQNVADIFTTDAVAAVLMCSTKSNYSWDIEIKKFDNKIFIDKRQEDQDSNILNFQTVCETSLDHQPMDEPTVNGIRNLMRESQEIQDAWQFFANSQDQTQQRNFEDPYPFAEDEEQVYTKMGYVYKIWRIQEKSEDHPEKKICIRCAVHSHTGKKKENGEFETMNLFALNEHSLERTNWRGSIDNQLVACLNKEIADNSFKVSRWLVQSMLADVDFIKFGFITRKSMNDPKKHVLVGTHTVNTASWAHQMNMQMDRMWNIVKRLIESIEHQDEIIKEDPKHEADENGNDEGEDEVGGSVGEYVLLKDFNKMEFRLYKKSDEEEEEEETEA